jgi:uncharacterized protein YndB with AHSA1/START domain
MNSSTDRIEREILLKAPRARVWRAISSAEEFGEWFGLALQGKNFTSGEWVKAKMTYPGYEHIVCEILIERAEPERLFSFRWHPYAIDPEIDYAKEPTTLVEFQLEESGEGTLLKVIESGFDQVPADRRALAFRMHCGGWEEQMKNIEAHVATP